MTQHKFKKGDYAWLSYGHSDGLPRLVQITTNEGENNINVDPSIVSVQWVKYPLMIADVLTHFLTQATNEEVKEAILEYELQK